MWQVLTRTTGDRVATLLRLALGAVMLPHGAQKLLGWFGGPGPQATIGFFEQGWGIPAGVTLLVIIAEFFGGLGLIAGFLTRLSAAGIVAVMAGAVALQHGSVGLFMNWSGQQAGEGFEYHILAAAIGLPLTLLGGGWASVDAVLARRFAPADHAAPAAPTRELVLK